MKTLKTLVLAVALTLTGCGGSATDDFVGLWTQTGTVTLSGNGQSLTNAVSGNQRISRGVAHEQIILNGDCAVPATVDGDVATVSPGFSCTQNSASGTTLTTYRTGTLTRSANAIVVSASGDVLLTTGGKSASVAFTLTETLTRIAE